MGASLKKALHSLRLIAEGDDIDMIAVHSVAVTCTEGKTIPQLLSGKERRPEADD
jgi:hypothetical protein